MNLGAWAGSIAILLLIIGLLCCLVAGFAVAYLLVFLWVMGMVGR